MCLGESAWGRAAREGGAPLTAKTGTGKRAEGPANRTLPKMWFAHFLGVCHQGVESSETEREGGAWDLGPRVGTFGSRRRGRTCFRAVDTLSSGG